LVRTGSGRKLRGLQIKAFTVRTRNVKDASKKRPPVPQAIADKLISDCRRICAMCFALQGDGTTKNGQVAHLDHDRSNNKPDNLAWLCLAHHDDYDSTRRQTRNFSPGEIKRYRASLLEAIASGAAPVSYSLRGASLRLRGTSGIVEQSAFKGVGAHVLLSARVSNSGSSATGIELARFSWKGEIIADEHWGIPIRFAGSDGVSKPDEDAFPDYADYLTCGPEQMVDPGRTQLFVVGSAVRAESAIMSLIEPLLSGGSQKEALLDPPAILELVPVIGPPVATEILKLLRKRC
jgi:hypothetical protein